MVHPNSYGSVKKCCIDNKSYSELESTILGVYVHGKAGDSIADVTSKRGILASEIIKKLPKTIKLIEENSSIYSDLERIEN